MIRSLLFAVLLLVVAVGIGQIARDLLRRLGWGAVLAEDRMDRGDIDAVVGPDAAQFVGVEGEDDGWNRTRAALWERLRGYPSLHDRREALRARAAAYVPGTLPG